MRPAQYYGVLHNAAKRRLIRLRTLANDAVISRRNNLFFSSNQLVSFVTLELHTLVANFFRAYYLSIVLGPRTEGGIRITCDPAIRVYEDAIDAAMKACKNKQWVKAAGGKTWSRYDEPKWHETDTLLRSCLEISSTNYGTVVTALSIPTGMFEHLTIFRNFFAHRNESTSYRASQIAIASYSIYSESMPVNILLTPAYGRPQELIFDWIDDANNAFDLLCA